MKPAQSSRPSALSPNGNGPSEAERLLTADDVAALLQVPKTWVYAEARAGRIPHVTLGRYRRFRCEAIVAWLEERERGPVGPANRGSRREIADGAGDLTDRGVGGSIGGAVRARGSHP